MSAARACGHRGRDFGDLGANSIEPRHVTFVAANGDAGAVRAFGFRLKTLAFSPACRPRRRDRDGQRQHHAASDRRRHLRRSRLPGLHSTTAPIARVITAAIGRSHTNFCLDDISRTNVLGAADSRHQTPKPASARRSSRPHTLTCTSCSTRGGSRRLCVDALTRPVCSPSERQACRMTPTRSRINVRHQSPRSPQSLRRRKHRSTCRRPARL